MSINIVYEYIHVAKGTHVHRLPSPLVDRTRLAEVEGQWEFNSLIACGMKLLQNLVILHRMLQYLLAEASSLNSPFCGWEGSVDILSALVTQRFCAMSWTGGREVPIIFSAVLTTLCSQQPRWRCSWSARSQWFLCRMWWEWEVCCMTNSLCGTANVVHRSWTVDQ